MSAERDTANLLLRSLSDDDWTLIQPCLLREPMHREKCLAQGGEPFDRLHFVESVVVSNVAVDGNNRTEVGLVGYEGVTGTHFFLGSDISPFDSYVQVDGGSSLSIAASDMRDLLARSATLHYAILAYVDYYHMQVSYGLVACAQSLMEARLARWLLLCHDRVDGDQIALTHEFMAIMIAAQRRDHDVAQSGRRGNDTLHPGSGDDP